VLVADARRLAEIAGFDPGYLLDLRAPAAS
jgi:hypothetical protein